MLPGWWPLPAPAVEEGLVHRPAFRTGGVCQQPRPGRWTASQEVLQGPSAQGRPAVPRSGEQRGQSRRGLKDHVC